MYKPKRKSLIIELSNRLCSILPVFFWLFLIFGFEEPIMAIVTICSALLHEMGHIGYIMIAKRINPDIRGVVSGFRIRSGGNLSYDEEIRTYLSGPAVNVLLFVLCSFLGLFSEDLFFMAAFINLATALSNLLPIDGYDGYGAIMAMINKHELGDSAVRCLTYLSTALVFIFCILSLYLLDRRGEGFWIFAVFFFSMLKCIKKSID